MHEAGAGNLFDRPCARDYEIDFAAVGEWTEPRLCIRSSGREYSAALGVSSLEKVRAHPVEYSPAKAAAGEHAQNEGFTIGALQLVDLNNSFIKVSAGCPRSALVPEARLTKMHSVKKCPEFEPKVLDGSACNDVCVCVCVVCTGNRRL